MINELEAFAKLKNVHFVGNRYWKAHNVMQVTCSKCGLVPLFIQGDLSPDESRAYAMELGEFHYKNPEVDIMASLYPGDDAA